MKFPVLETSKVKSFPPILIVDKVGVIGETLAIEFSKDFLVVLASSRFLSEKNENIIHVLFRKRVPEVPDSQYSKIFIIDDGESVTRQSTASFISKARESNTPLYFVGSIRNVDVEHADEIARSYNNAKVLIFGDLFDKNIFFDKDSAIGRYILQARRNFKIEVSGNGLSLSFPITFEDTIKLIVKASYVVIPQKIILLFYPHPITDISLAHIFQKINPSIVIDYVKEKQDKKIYIPQGGQHAIGKYNLQERIKELDIEDDQNRELKVLNKEKKRSRSLFKPLMGILTVCIFILLLPLITTGFYSILAVREINNAKALAEKGEFIRAIEKTRNSKTFFEAAEKISDALLLEAKIIGRENDGRNITSQISSGRTLAQATEYLIEGAIVIKKIYSGESKDSKGDFSKASNSFKSAVGLIQKVKAEGDLPKDFSDKLKDIEPLINMFTYSSDVLPEVLGFDKEKSYLVLFQNNMELRPGGGFIGSFAILKVKNGKINDFSIEDVYQMDGQLKIHVEPPYPIRRYLPSAHLYLRDSNFDPDFVNSAISASNMYSLEAKRKVDGVIGVDLSFARNIVEAIGPISVTDYNKKIDENNLYSVTQEQAEKHFFAGSTQKKDFLSALAKSLEVNLITRERVPYFLLAQAVGKSVKEKHLIFAFEDSNQQDIFTANGWSSSLWDNRKNEKGRINDYLAVSEANLGVNKVNYFVSRSISKKVSITSSGKVSSKLTIGIKNNSVSTDKLGGVYKNYLRIIVPQGSILNSIAIDGKEVQVKPAITNYAIYEAKTFKPPSGLEVEQSTEFGKTIFGFLISVPQRKIKTVTLSYTLPYLVSGNDKSVNYSLKLFKQPGIDSYPFDLSFFLPGNYQILEDKKSYSKEIRSDEDINFAISQR